MVDVKSPESDILIARTQQENKPAPKENKEVVQEDMALSSKDVARVISDTKFSDPDLPRFILELIGAGGRVDRLDTVFAKNIEQMRQAGQVSLAIDVERAMVMKRAIELGYELPKAQEKYTPELHKLREEAEELMKKAYSLIEERKAFADEPNQVAEFASSLGVDPKEAKINPLAGTEEIIVSAINDAGARQELFTLLDKSDQLDSGQKEKFKQSIEDFAKQSESKGKKIGKKVAMVGSGAGLIMLLTGWFALKMESKGKQ